MADAIHSFRVGSLQHCGLVLYILDSCHEEDGPFLAELVGNSLKVAHANLQSVWQRIVDATNSADDDRDVELRDALHTLSSRILKVSYGQ